ncbi:hypothetical protein GCM10010112_87260 [Actinoplanes lobatus]|uniref:Uncharacterized protein n=1 Tax=Actinoplanes lobatus TaxID=113568 RepID=A0A7W7MEX0_9ACTN|nr:hypothetical protein [Actinoplanes lobatus]MBB4747739.1 hypothetical protein [Actinoplanes lobatus]GGN96209.1 hypothetical protein GCM10010112_87260 [Actinoplanes lobatus]GIE45190.1 hypothetical protein Alo02nite_80880 [Actinoplanes lobatus]
MSLPAFPQPSGVITDRLAARLRTLWPMVVGHLAALALIHGAPVLNAVESATGYRPTATEITLALGLTLGYLVYETGRALEQVTGDGGPARFARVAGRFLLSLGVPTGRPAYQR